MAEKRPQQTESRSFLHQNKRQTFQKQCQTEFPNIQTSNPRTTLYCRVRKDTGKSETVKGQESFHTAGGPAGYLWSATRCRFCRVPKYGNSHRTSRPMQDPTKLSCRV